MKKVIIMENGQKKVVTCNDTPSKTQQSFKEQCDINNIIKKYRDGGEVHHLNTKRGAYLDLTNLPSYQTALNTVIQAQDSFMDLPATTRKRFSNDPSQMIEFLSNPDNYDESIKLGLREKPIVPVDKMDMLIDAVNKTNSKPTPTKSKTSKNNDES